MAGAFRKQAVHWVRSVMTVIVVMVIATCFESAAGFASRAGACFQALVGAKGERCSRA